MENFKDYIDEELIEVTNRSANRPLIKTVYFYLTFAIVLIFSSLTASLLIGIITFHNHAPITYGMFLGWILGMFTSIIYVIAANIANIGWKTRRKKEIIKKFSSFPFKIYENYYDKKEIKNENIKLIKLVNANNMLFEINGTLIEWYINEEISEKQKTVNDSKNPVEKFSVYTLNYAMRVNSKKVANIKKEELEKILNLDQQEKIEILNNEIVELSFKGDESLEPIRANLYDFGDTIFTSNQSISFGISYKIESDFEKVQNLLNKFEPLLLN